MTMTKSIERLERQYNEKVQNYDKIVQEHPYRSLEAEMFKQVFQDAFNKFKQDVANNNVDKDPAIYQQDDLVK